MPNGKFHHHAFTTDLRIRNVVLSPGVMFPHGKHVCEFSPCLTQSPVGPRVEEPRVDVGRTADGSGVAKIGSHGIDDGQHGLVAAGVGRGNSQSPPDHNLSMDSTDGMDFSHFFISAAVRFKDKNANRSAQRDVAAHAEIFGGEAHTA